MATTGSLEDRLYLSGKRWSADFRDFADVGGGREALKPEGSKRGTTDRDTALRVALDRLEELKERRLRRKLFGTDPAAPLDAARLEAYAQEHLVKKAEAGKVTADTLARHERYLSMAAGFFGADTPLTDISVTDVQRWLAHLRKRRGQRGRAVSGQTLRHYLNALSHLYRRAQSEKRVPPGYNPVAALGDEKPAGRRVEARWLEVPEAALLLEAARLREPKREDIAVPLYPILATLLLTGGRFKEVMGLEVDDVSFDRRTVTFRPHPHRRLKTPGSHRVVPLWPQLEAVLRAHVFGADAPPGRLLFPGTHGRVRRADEERMITDIRRPLDDAAEAAGWSRGDIRTKMFRHTYCAARLQTLDRGAPVAPWTVSKELGHGGTGLVERVYGHLGTARHRAETVEYPVESVGQVPDPKSREALAERLRRVRSGAAEVAS